MNQRQEAVRARGKLLASIVAVATLVPLYAILVAVVIRSSLFDFNGSTLTDVQFKGLWTFVGVTVTASAVMLGAWFAKLNNDRTLASTTDNELRRDALTRETHERQKLETAVACLGLISKDGAYASSASIAGGLATLVQLGHPIIAIRALISALGDRKVDMDTSTWVIGKVLTTEYTTGTADDLAAAKEEAAQLLYSRVRDLASDKVAGEFCWPDAVMAQWPRNAVSPAPAIRDRSPRCAGAWQRLAGTSRMLRQESATGSSLDQRRSSQQRSLHRARRAGRQRAARRRRYLAFDEPQLMLPLGPVWNMRSEDHR